MVSRELSNGGEVLELVDLQMATHGLAVDLFADEGYHLDDGRIVEPGESIESVGVFVLIGVVSLLHSESLR
jgi:hypothetical protein